MASDRRRAPPAPGSLHCHLPAVTPGRLARNGSVDPLAQSRPSKAESSSAHGAGAAVGFEATAPYGAREAAPRPLMSGVLLFDGPQRGDWFFGRTAGGLVSAV